MNRVGKGLAGLAAVTALAGCIPFAQAATTDQSSPDGVLAASYNALHRGDFNHVCELLTAAPARADGKVCEVAMASRYTDTQRAAMTNVQINMTGVDTSTGRVVIPEAAVTFDGAPAKDNNTTVVKIDGKWWISRA